MAYELMKVSERTWAAQAGVRSFRFAAILA